jgi:hypothetical protein
MDRGRVTRSRSPSAGPLEVAEAGIDLTVDEHDLHLPECATARAGLLNRTGLAGESGFASWRPTAVGKEASHAVGAAWLVWALKTAWISSPALPSRFRIVSVRSEALPR